MSRSDRDNILGAGLSTIRTGANRGRVLAEPVASLGLVQGDRLEPSRGLPDIGAFEEITDFPADVILLRSSCEYAARHRNHVLTADLGLGPCDALCVDVLHAVNLGSLKEFVRVAIWWLVDACRWGFMSTVEDTVTVAIRCITHELTEWYRARHQRYPQEGLTRTNMTKKLGTANNHVLRACVKDGQANHVHFVVCSLLAHQWNVHDPRLPP